MHTLLASRPNVVASTRRETTRRARCERGLRRSAASLCDSILSVCLQDKTKTAETTIAKLAAWNRLLRVLVHY